MSQYPNSGTLSKAKQPKINPQSADYNGAIDIQISLIKEMLEEARQQGKDEIHVKLSAWIVEGPYGKFFSLRASNWKPTPAAPQQRQIPEDDSDIPF
jgi:hypothetical protein